MKKQTKFKWALLFIVMLIIMSVFGSSALILHKAKMQFGPADMRLSIFSRLKKACILNQHNTELKNPNTSSDAFERQFLIGESENVMTICERLKYENFIENEVLMCTLLSYSGRDRAMQPGSYTLKNGLSMLEIAQRIGNPNYRDIPLRVYAGWRLEEIALAIDMLPFRFSGQEFLNFAKNTPEDFKNVYDFLPETGLEGLILPGLYFFKPESDINDVLEMMLDSFNKQVTQTNLKNQIEETGLTLLQGLTLASIIQRETLADDEMPMMASVFFNRLKLGMKLETDVTVQYALGWNETENTWWKTTLTWDDLATDSVYNTYRVYGLPPGPIGSAGLSAIQAVANPAKSNYLFFRASCDGSGTHQFATTYEEHLNNDCD